MSVELVVADNAPRGSHKESTNIKTKRPDEECECELQQRMPGTSFGHEFLYSAQEPARASVWECMLAACF